MLAATARLMSPKSMASLTLLSKNSTACLLWPLCVCVPFRKQVRQHLEEVRLAGAEEARNPDAHLAGRVGVLRSLVASPSRYQEMNLRKCWSSSLVMTNSSNSCQTEESSSWSAFTTPLMGRKMSRSKRFLMSMSASLTAPA